MEKVYKVKGEEKYVIHIATYQNGIETTGGFYKQDELERVFVNVLSITYDSKHATELPLAWPRMKFLDDSNNRQFIKAIRYEDEPAYIMQDGTLSNEVTE